LIAQLDIDMDEMELDIQDTTSSNSANANIRNAAIGLLSRREHSKKELLDKLSRKFSNKHDIQIQIDQLEQEGLQSEERFVELFIRSKKSQGKGPKYIKQELRLRGISEYLVASYIYDNDDEWEELARTVYEKKYGLSPPENPSEKSKRIRFMVSRGFAADLAFKLFDPT